MSAPGTPTPMLGGSGFLAGVNGYVKIGTVYYCFDKWKMSMKNTLVEVTSFCSGGYQVMLPGIFSATITISGPYDSGNMPFTVGEAVALVLGFSSSLSITCNGFIETLEPDVDVKGRCSLAMTVQSSGSFAGSVTREGPLGRGVELPVTSSGGKAA